MFVSAYAAVKSYLPDTPSKAVVAAAGAFLVKSYFQSSWPVTLLSGLAFSAIARIADRCLAGAPKLVDACDSDDEWDFKNAKHSAPPSGPNSAQPSPTAGPAEPPFTPPPSLVLGGASPATVRAEEALSPTSDSDSGTDVGRNLVMDGRMVISNGVAVVRPKVALSSHELPTASLNPKFSPGSGSLPSPVFGTYFSAVGFRPISSRAGSPYITIGEHGY